MSDKKYNELKQEYEYACSREDNCRQGWQEALARIANLEHERQELIRQRDEFKDALLSACRKLNQGKQL